MIVANGSGYERSWSEFQNAHPVFSEQQPDAPEPRAVIDVFRTSFVFAVGFSIYRLFWWFTFERLEAIYVRAVHLIGSMLAQSRLSPLPGQLCSVRQLSDLAAHPSVVMNKSRKRLLLWDRKAEYKRLHRKLSQSTNVYFYIQCYISISIIISH